MQDHHQGMDYPRSQTFAVCLGMKQGIDYLHFGDTLYSVYVQVQLCNPSRYKYPMFLSS